MRKKIGTVIDEDLIFKAKEAALLKKAITNSTEIAYILGIALCHSCPASKYGVNSNRNIVFY